MPGCWKISSGTAVPLVEIAVGAVILGAELDPRDVADPGDAPVGVGADDDVGELPRLDQPAQRLDVELEGARIRHRRLVQHARGDLDVLRLERRDDVAGGEAARAAILSGSSQMRME